MSTRTVALAHGPHRKALEKIQRVAHAWQRIAVGANALEEQASGARCSPTCSEGRHGGRQQAAAVAARQRHHALLQGAELAPLALVDQCTPSLHAGVEEGIAQPPGPRPNARYHVVAPGQLVQTAKYI
ncbi:MAG: hypothetical protein EOO62_19795 [Hymenobacter sp.]|nr:MAG: hypothetical protein EOO62_19795 [Hymenobacter sp.]